MSEAGEAPLRLHRLRHRVLRPHLRRLAARHARLQQRFEGFYEKANNPEALRIALSGVPAGNTALCTVGRSGNDLHYRGYDILEVAEACEFEEIAYLLIHGKLPNRAELASQGMPLRLELRPA